MILKENYRNYWAELQIVHRKQLSPNVSKTIVSTLYQITAPLELKKNLQDNIQPIHNNIKVYKISVYLYVS